MKNTVFSPCCCTSVPTQYIQHTSVLTGSEQSTCSASTVRSATNYLPQGILRTVVRLWQVASPAIQFFLDRNIYISRKCLIDHACSVEKLFEHTEKCTDLQMSRGRLSLLLRWACFTSGDPWQTFCRLGFLPRREAVFGQKQEETWHI